MKKRTILILALATAMAAVASTPAVRQVVVPVDELLTQSEVNRTLARVFAPFSDSGSAYFEGRADVLEELAARAEERANP